MKRRVIEDPYGRYRVTFEADDALFRKALRHELADLVLDLVSRTGLGALIEGGLWPEDFLLFLRRYMDDMKAMLAKGSVELGSYRFGSASLCRIARPRITACCARTGTSRQRLG